MAYIFILSWPSNSSYYYYFFIFYMVNKSYAIFERTQCNALQNCVFNEIFLLEQKLLHIKVKHFGRFLEFSAFIITKSSYSWRQTRWLLKIQLFWSYYNVTFCQIFIKLDTLKKKSRYFWCCHRYFFYNYL